MHAPAQGGRWRAGVERWGARREDVPSAPVDELAAREFRGDFVDRCLPVLVHGATAHWPAAERWHDQAYLDRRLTGERFEVRTRPVLEMRWRQRRWPERFVPAFAAQPHEVVDYAEFAERARGGEFVFAYAVGLDESSGLAALQDDVGGFAAVPKPRRPHYYRPKRAFVHGLSYTDWHYHPDDNTFMCQFGREKTVYLLPPDQATWDVIASVAEHEDHVGPADPARYPQLRKLAPRVAHVRPGDALYIPPNWWHAVECTEPAGQLGLTVAWCWASPLHIRLEPRFPFRGFFERHGPLKRRLQLRAARIAWRALALTGRVLEEIPSARPATA